MSRTIKDMPFVIRACKDEGRKAPNYWREKWGWRYAIRAGHPESEPKRRDYDDYDDYLAALTAFEADRPYIDYCSDPIVGVIARDQNRLYRARSKQAIREGRYDDLMPPKRNARWLAW